MIRNATPDDIENITNIYNEVIVDGGFTGDIEPLSIDNRRTWYSDYQGRYSIFVKVTDGTVVGYVTLSPYRKGRGAFDETCEVSYYVSSKYRGRGFGTELVEHALSSAKKLCFSLVIAIILSTNKRSIDLLTKFGFSVAGVLPRAAKINGEYIDHVYLSRLL